VEQITALRLIPNLVVIRPADANETATAWKVALERKDGPTALILTRQKLPVVTAHGNALARGAYVLAETAGESPDVVLIAAGSEVTVALDARGLLAQDGIDARVVSMPSWVLFDAQPADYRSAILPPNVPRLAIEAGTPIGWERYLNGNGAVIGLNHFGASAPYKILFEQFGFTAENVAHRARLLLRSGDGS
jgi:transketolase